MISLLRKCAVPFVIACLGLAALWWMAPHRPRDGWQPPPGEDLVAILDDSREIITRDDRDPGQCTIRFWDSETGQQRACHVVPKVDPKDLIRFVRGGNYLRIERFATDSSGRSFVYQMVLLDARSGVEIWSRNGRISGNPLEGNLAWAITADGKLTAYGAIDALGRHRLYVEELPSGRVLQSLADLDGTLRFSHDGSKLLIAAEIKSSTIIDVKSGEVLAQWDIGQNPLRTRPHLRLNEFTPDDKLLVDSDGNVRDVPSGAVVSRIPLGGYYVSIAPNGETLLVPEHNASERDFTWSLKSYHLRTGVELTERRVRLGSKMYPTMYNATPGGELLIVEDWRGNPGVKEVLEEFFSQIPVFGSAVPRFRNGKTDSRLIHADTAQLILKTRLTILACSQDGRYFAADTGRGFHLYDLPPSKSLRWFGAAAGLWLLAPTVWCWWRFRRTSNSSRPQPAANDQ